MSVWRYAWTLGPLLGATALGVNVMMKGGVMAWIGGLIVACGVLGLLLVLVKEVAERYERANAFYRIDGPQATYLYSFTEFERLPEPVQQEIYRDAAVKAWHRQERRRHGIEELTALQGGRIQRLRYRLALWILNFLT